MKNKFDVIVVGAGHNGLTAACYLAKAGYKVLVLERREVVGGSVITESNIFPGFQIDTCSCFHVVIHGTPVLKDLQLEKYGLEYMKVDPWAFAPFPNGNKILFYQDVDRTAESIAKFSPRDAEVYRKFLDRWMKFNATIMEVFCLPPQFGKVVGRIAKRQMATRAEFLRIAMRPDVMRDIFSPFGTLLRRHFESPEVRAAVAWLGAQSGPGPREATSGELMAMQLSLYHSIGLRRPRGGSGQLTQALAKCLQDNGGEVMTGAEVSKFLVQNGTVEGVELADGERYYASKIMSSAHVQTTLLKLLPEGTLPAKLEQKVRNLKIANGFGMTVRCATDNLPNYSIMPTRDENGVVQPGLPHQGMQLLNPSLEYLEKTYEDASFGFPPRNPSVLVMTPSAVDDTVTPPGKHVLDIWAQTHPYRLSNGEKWDDIKEREAEKCLSVVEQYAPGTRASVQGMYIKSPLDLERINGLVQGNLMHVDMTIKQMFFWRPLPELAKYRTPVRGLYLTGASTHPGGGVSGAPGYNAAHTLLTDLAAKN